MSAYSIARATLDSALNEAAGSGVDAETLLRALIATAAERYQDGEGVPATRSMLEFQLANCAGDEDYEFMRP